MNLDPAERAGLTSAGYLIEEEIGRGASGVVYLAHQELIDRRVALKRVPDDGTARRLDREVAALVALEHPGVVRLMDVVRQPGSVWFVMEYVDGPTLRQVLDAGPLSVPDALGILEQLSVVLDFVAGRRIVHRDLKPGNVFVTSGGRAKIGDFGVALVGDAASARVTRPGTVVGTPAYLSPEQAGAWSEPTAASDLYSLGVIAYELLAGQVPFRRRGNVLALLAAQEAEPPPLPSEFRAALAGSVDSALLGPLAKDPKKRPPSAGEFFSELSRAVDETWPGWRQAVKPVQMAPVIRGPRAAPADETVTAEGVLELEPPRTTQSMRTTVRPRRHRRRRRNRYLLPAGVFVVAVVGSYAAVRATSSGGGSALRIESIALSCSAGTAIATLTTNGGQGEVHYRWSGQPEESLRAGSQRVVMVRERGAGAPVTFFLISPQTRQESLPRPGGC